MKTPSFWYQKPGLLSYVLWPFGWLYGKGGRVVSSFKSPQRFRIPIISIGNIVSGGSGKTPTAIALAQLLGEKGIKVHFVTRGYGGRLKGPLLVDLSSHTHNEVGDEPLLLAQFAPTWVAKDRPLGVQAAMEEGADLIILDDGHQTASLHKDLSFVVVDQVQGFGNGQVIPAGPLREKLSDGLSRADALINIGGTPYPFEKQTFRANAVFQPLEASRVFAFCGLGFPQKFYKSLKDQGIDVAAEESFPDHYIYQERDLVRLFSLADKHKAELVTTRKDWVRLPHNWRDRVQVLDMRIEFDNTDEVYAFIMNRMVLHNLSFG